MMLSDLPELHADSRVAAAALAAAFHTAGVKLQRQLGWTGARTVDLRSRQVECLFWARQGKSSTDIGCILEISARTVDEHISHACDALGVRTRIQAVARAVALGMI